MLIYYVIIMNQIIFSNQWLFSIYKIQNYNTPYDIQ